MKKQLIECVPNFSEGRNIHIIKQITDQIEKVKEVKLLNVDPGKATNRTVVTFVGDPESVIEAAFRAIKKASEIIDMRCHHGEHPRMGATDVCPLVPVSNISMDEVIEFAHRLGYRVGEELGIPGYYYEYAAKSPERKNLAYCRTGEYEGLKKRLIDPEWIPDFGPARFNAGTGATAIGARDFLVAYNINLNTTSTRRANAIAFDIREKGRIKREGDPLTGRIIRDKNGDPVYEPGTLKNVKGIGWYIEEYGIAQLSFNLTNISETPIHVAFEEAVKKAELRGVRVTGSELVGLVPLQAMLEAGRYFLTRQQRSLGIPEEEVIAIAIKSLGLEELSPFNPRERIIEYMLEEPEKDCLVDMNLTRFANASSSESVTPGGGSVAAYLGALGISLGTMVANISSHKRGWDDRWEEFSKQAEQGEKLKVKLLKLVDADTKAFREIIEARRLPKTSEADKNARKKAIREATKKAVEVPFNVMKVAMDSMEVIRYVAEHGMKSSLSDACVGAIAANAAIRGAYLNILINCKDLEDEKFKTRILTESERIKNEAVKNENEILSAFDKNLKE
ncbi:MAG: glutamate formimidoyltransferase [Cyclobacteriaceae bacterium]|nr:glutamate formimidoyltransferase [Cyclobacteriaceae bacterium]